MKTINSIPALTLVLILGLNLGFISCKKTTTGPAGAAGTSGQQGVAGPQGNANVKSFLFNTGTTWRADSACKTYYFKYHIADLSTSVLKDGAVILYLGEDNGNEWKTMPLSNKGINFNFTISLSTVEIYVSAANGALPVNPGAQDFKLVIIPPGA